MKRIILRLLGLLIAIWVAIPSTVHATNGMFLIGQGAKARGMGGVAIATPQDALSGAANPATIGFVADRADVGADFFVPSASARLGDVTVDSSANRFVMPAMGGVYKFNRKISIGFSAVPAGGGGSRYNTNQYNSQTGTEPTETLGVNLMIMQMNPTAAYRINKRHRVGASLVIGVQTFRAFGLDYFSTFTSTGLFTENLTNNGNDWAYGLGGRLGYMGKFFKDRVALGLTYSSRVHMSKFEKYSDLFAEQGGIDTPENYGAGINLKLTDKLSIGFDVTRILYSDIRSIGNPGPNIKGTPYPESQELNALGKDGGLGFGWDDQTAYKVGISYDFNPRWTFRTGWNFADSPIDEKNGGVLFNIVAPAVVRNHLTLGATYKLSKRIEWSFSYVHAFEYEQEGPTFIGGTGSLKMEQDSFGASFGFKL